MENFIIFTVTVQQHREAFLKEIMNAKLKEREILLARVRYVH